MGVQLFVRRLKRTLTDAGKANPAQRSGGCQAFVRNRNEARRWRMARQVLHFARDSLLSSRSFQWLRSARKGAHFEACQLHSDSMASVSKC